jgi:putative glutamine amidotransferase
MRQTNYPHQPIIGLPTYSELQGKPDLVMRTAYVTAIVSAGGVPLLVPLLEDTALLRRLYGLLDGLLLCGGGDVEPARYGAPDVGRTTLADPQRDSVELALTQWALADGLPILGICRGVQLLNVAAGGTLIQDIPAEVPQAGCHSYPTPKNNPDHPAHSIRTAPESRLAALLGLTENARPHVNSRHHQAVREVAPSFVATAWAEDGLIEGIERRDQEAGLAVGVQWHPENLVPAHQQMVHLFRGYVATCQRR